MANFFPNHKVFTNKIAKLLSSKASWIRLIVFINFIVPLTFSVFLLFLFVPEKCVEFKKLISYLVLPLHLFLLIEIVLSLVIILDLHLAVLLEALS